MLAACYVGDRTVELLETEPRRPGVGEVEIAVAYTGICGTDLHIVHGAMDARVARPAVLGHEMSGSIAAVGEGVDGWSVGDHVTVMPLDWCGDCPACRAGHSHICHNLNFLGIDSPGSMQPSWVVPADVLVALPSDLPPEVARWSSRRRWRCTTCAGRTSVRVRRPSSSAAGRSVFSWRASRVPPERTCSFSSSASSGARLRRPSDLNAVDPTTSDVAALVADWTDGAGVAVGFEVSGAVARARHGDRPAGRPRAARRRRDPRDAAAGQPVPHVLARADAHRRARLRPLGLRAGDPATARGRRPGERGSSLGSSR